MTYKNKSTLEDIFIILVFCSVIYAIYYFVFDSNEQEIQTTTNTEQVIQESPKEETTIEETKEPEVQSTIAEDKTDEIKEEDIIKDENLPKKELTTTQKNSTETLVQDGTITIEDFYKSIEEKIYANISKDVDKNTITNKESVNIRITILKDGRYEQLTYMEGNKEYFEQIKTSIYKVFPLKIDESLKENFPRYFRMKVEF